MSKETREHLSALVDGEISRETSRFLVRRLGSDDELRSTWTRYHLVRDCLRHQDGAIAGDDLCARVSHALENEQAGKPSRSLPTGWLKPVAGLAIAASVALMAIVAVGPGVTGAPQAASDLAAGVQPKPFTSPQVSQFSAGPYSSQASNNGTTGRELNSYLARHYQVSGATGGRGLAIMPPMFMVRAVDGSDTASAQDTPQPEADKDQESELR